MEVAMISTDSGDLFGHLAQSADHSRAEISLTIALPMLIRADST